MKSQNILIILSLILIASRINAQDYEILFSGTGASQSVDSVIIENLTLGVQVSLNGNDILRLYNLPTGLPGIRTNISQLEIYPNPARDYATIEFQSTKAGNAVMSIYDISGRSVALKSTYLPAGKHSFMLEGLGNGIYIIKVVTKDNLLSGRIVVTDHPDSHANIRLNKSVASDAVSSRHKSTASQVELNYQAGDLLKFTCFSGIYTTVVMDRPMESKTIVIQFVECLDGDNQSYPVVQIGNQIWMAENLKSTHFTNGSSIRQASGSESWRNDTTAAFAYYEDSLQLVDIYGLLYNWNAAADTAGICPSGWHLPTDAEWIILRDTLGGRREAGGKIKETGTTRWHEENTEAENSSGFTGRPSGMRNSDGGFEGIGETAQWWSSTPYGTDSALNFMAAYNSARLNTIMNSKQAGLSVRCLSGVPELPVVITGATYPIELTTATGGGKIISDGGAYIMARGICWGTQSFPTIEGNHSSDSTGTGSFTFRMMNLEPGMTYHIRAYAMNATGVAYGADSIFKTLTQATLPVVKAGEVSVKNSTTAIAVGDIISDGGDPILARGVCWSLNSNPGVELGTKTTEPGTTGSFTAKIEGLARSVTYHIRIYATNSQGTSYGPESTFSIIMNESGPQVSDIENNHYKTVYIGNQLWMAENLKTTQFNDGSLIPSNSLSSSEWLALLSPALCYYDNDVGVNKNLYGPLYNWYAVADERKLCPTGWHIPSNEEWLVLRNYLGGESSAGGKMKDVVSGLWSFPNTGGDNISGYTALPGGDRDDGAFGSIHNGTGWWSSSEVNEEDAWSHYLYYSSSNFFPSPDAKVSGCSVRCLKD